MTFYKAYMMKAISVTKCVCDIGVKFSVKGWIATNAAGYLSSGPIKEHITFAPRSEICFEYFVYVGALLKY